MPGIGRDRAYKIRQQRRYVVTMGKKRVVGGGNRGVVRIRVGLLRNRVNGCALLRGERFPLESEVGNAAVVMQTPELKPALELFTRHGCRCFLAARVRRAGELGDKRSEIVCANPFVEKAVI